MSPFTSSSAQSGTKQPVPDVPEKYKRLFFEYSDRDLLEKMLNSVGKTSLKVGRSYALVAGVTQYPNFPGLVDQLLKPAEIDITKVKTYLKDQEYFDEIVVLQDKDMNLENLYFFLETYFPRRLATSPHARFLFAYTGHGYAEKSGQHIRGYILTDRAVSKTDEQERIDLDVLRTMFNSVIDSAEKVLVLMNACQSGAFLGRQTFGRDPLGIGERGAHAIMASRSSQNSFGSPEGGSFFFDKILAGLDGIADANKDGVVTYHELYTYLRSEIPSVTNGAQIPVDGDISRDGSVGEFFFLNRHMQVQAGNSKPWNPGNAMTFGVVDNESLERGKEAFKKGDYGDAYQALEKAAGAGNAEAVNILGLLIDLGVGLTKDHKQARDAFQKAALIGIPAAMYRLGTFYETGNGGTEEDYVEARHWYLSAAEAGSAPAMYHLGMLYENGRGLDRDLDQARQWYQKAAAAGNEDAVARLKQLLSNATP